MGVPSLSPSIYAPSRRENSSNGTPVQSVPTKTAHLSVPLDECSRLLGEYIEWYRDGKLKKDLGWKTIREYREERGYAA